MGRKWPIIIPHRTLQQKLFPRGMEKRIYILHSLALPVRPVIANHYLNPTIILSAMTKFPALPGFYKAVFLHLEPGKLSELLNSQSFLDHGLHFYVALQ